MNVRITIGQNRRGWWWKVTHTDTGEWARQDGVSDMDMAWGNARDHVKHFERMTAASPVKEDRS